MPSRRQLLRRLGAAAATASATAAAGCVGTETVRTKVGVGSTDTIDLESPDADVFVGPGRYPAYVDRLEREYGENVGPWKTPDALDGEFVGAATRRMVIVPDRRLGVHDAAVLVHRLDERRYRLRAWSAGRLLGREYEVDPWGYVREDPGFTWLEQEIEPEGESTLSARRSDSTAGGTVEVTGLSVGVPDGRFESGADGSDRFRSRWEGFHRGLVPVIGACEVSFAPGDERRLDWHLSNGIGIRTPY